MSSSAGSTGSSLAAAFMADAFRFDAMFGTMAGFAGFSFLQMSFVGAHTWVVWVECSCCLVRTQSSATASQCSLETGPVQRMAFSRCSACKSQCRAGSGNNAASSKPNPN